MPPLHWEKPANRFFDGLPEGVYLVSNVGYDPDTPVFAAYVAAPGPARSGQWKRIKVCQVDHRHYGVYRDEAGFREDRQSLRAGLGNGDQTTGRCPAPPPSRVGSTPVGRPAGRRENRETVPVPRATNRAWAPDTAIASGSPGFDPIKRGKVRRIWGVPLFRSVNVPSYGRLERQKLEDTARYDVRSPFARRMLIAGEQKSARTR